MIAVISGKKQEFDEFIKPWVDIDDKEKFRFIGRIQDVRGVNFSEVIRIGTHYNLKNSYEIYNAALMRIK
jgi:hypothetical protein